MDKKTIVVVGAGQGLGNHVAMRFGKEGFRVVLMTRQWEDNVIPLCRELGIGFVAYSPMAGGLLSGKYSAQTEYKGDDIRRVISRYKPENVASNQPIIDLVKRYAQEKHCTPAQISLAWVMKQEYIIPIPGMRSDARISDAFKRQFGVPPGGVAVSV